MKKMFFGLAVAAIALSASAFTNQKIAAGDTYVQTDADLWVRISAPAVFNEDLCLNESTKECFYKQAPGNTADYGQTLTSTQISAINGLTFPQKLAPSSAKGIYDGPTE